MVDKQSKLELLQKAIFDLRKTNELALEAKISDPLVKEKLQRINDQIDILEEEVKNQMSIDNAKQLLNDNLSNANSGVMQTKSGKSFSKGMNYKNISDYLRKGLNADGTIDNGTGGGLQISSSTGSLGYNASYTIADSIYEYLKEYSVMRKLCSSIIVSRDSLDMPLSDNDITCAWESSGGTVVAAVSTPVVTNSIKTFELTAQPKVTQKMIDDTAIDLESWLIEKLAALFLVNEDAAFINGDGQSKPRGILKYQKTAGHNGEIERIKSGKAAAFDENGLLKLYYSLNDFYSVNASFLMNKSTLQQIRTFKDATSGQYYWMSGVLFGKADTLLGCPVYTNSSISNVAAGADAIIYGDMKHAYQIVDRSEITIQRDPYSSKPFVIFYATKRVGGDVVDPYAVKVLNIAA